MTYLVIVFIGLIVATIVAFIFSAADIEWYNCLAAIFGVFLLCGVLFVGIALAFTGYSYVASQYKADVINREYDTNYTAKEIMYASNVIETIQELKRTRIEVNGNIFTGEGD